MGPSRLRGEATVQQVAGQQRQCHASLPWVPVGHGCTTCTAPVRSQEVQEFAVRLGQERHLRRLLRSCQRVHEGLPAPLPCPSHRRSRLACLGQLLACLVGSLLLWSHLAYRLVHSLLACFLAFSFVAHVLTSFSVCLLMCRLVCLLLCLLMCGLDCLFACSCADLFLCLFAHVRTCVFVC